MSNIENPEVKFASDSANNIFVELCESEFFHIDEEMTVEFIEKIMADDKHAEAIKGKIKTQILADLTLNPDAFEYNSDKNPVYDANMRDDYEGIATEYIREIFYEGKTKCVYLCMHCGSDNVQVKAWVRPNKNNEYVDEVNEGDEPGWCDDCDQTAIIETASIPMNKKVVGFQVVGEDGTSEEGEIHPNMNASFCLYNLSQAREMLNSNVEGQWRLLTLWSGDVEEPTMMFEGDPRD